MVTVVDGQEMGLAATSDLSEAGLYQAARVAREWAHAAAGRGVLDFSAAPRPLRSGSWSHPVEQPWESCARSDIIERLKNACQGLKTDDRIIRRVASLRRVRTESCIATTDDIQIEQVHDRIVPWLVAVASDDEDVPFLSDCFLGITCCVSSIGVLFSVCFNAFISSSIRALYLPMMRPSSSM